MKEGKTQIWIIGGVRRGVTNCGLTEEDNKEGTCGETWFWVKENHGTWTNFG
jgi:hypothetical protein